jgi:hypothetical protein
MNYVKDEISGSYYSLEDGALVQYPMNIDGSMDNNGAIVDLDELIFDMPLQVDGREIDTHEHLLSIKSKLELGIDVISI